MKTNKNFNTIVKTLIAAFFFLFGTFLFIQYDEFVEYESYENEIIKLSDELFGNINRKDIYRNRLKLISICNDKLNRDYKIFEDLINLTDEEWSVLTESTENFNTINISMIYAQATIKEKYYKSITIRSPWMDEETQNTITEGYENYISMKEEKNKHTIIRFLNYLLS